MYNYNHLYYFYITAKVGSVSKAAEFLKISQPSLSSQIKTFERNIDRKLFEKKGRGISLTTDGQTAFTYCKKMFAVSDDLKLKFLQNNINKKFNIGVSSQIERPFVADIISPVLKQRKNLPDTVFSINSGTDLELLTALKNEDIDALLTNKLSYDESLEDFAAINMPVNLMIATEYLEQMPIKYRKNFDLVTFLNLIDLQLIMPSENLRIRTEIDSFFQDRKIRKAISFESDLVSVVARAIVDGAGIGFLPRNYFIEEIKRKQMTALGPKFGFWKHKIYLLIKKQEKYSPALYEIKKSMKNLELIS